MAVPRNRHSTSRRNSKRAHSALTPKLFSVCTNCRGHAMPHRICPSCGYYKGRSYKKDEATS